jgi:tetratricopeptide (TPR) repeat protein
MAENPFLEGLTGGESEGGDAETTSAGIDPVASSVAMDAAKYDPLLANKVGDYLERQAEAQAIYAAEPNTVACRAFHADGLEHRGDHVGADAAYAQAIALAPDLPFAYHRQGLTLLARGDLDAAAAKFEAAHIRGPHWADPLKGEGDVLARKGQWAAAVARYDQALKFAPAWAELHQARDMAFRRAAAR